MGVIWVRSITTVFWPRYSSAIRALRQACANERIRWRDETDSIGWSMVENLPLIEIQSVADWGIRNTRLRNCLWSLLRDHSQLSAPGSRKAMGQRMRRSGFEGPGRQNPPPRG